MRIATCSSSKTDVISAPVFSTRCTFSRRAIKGIPTTPPRQPSMLSVCAVCVCSHYLLPLGIVLHLRPLSLHAEGNLPVKPLCPSEIACTPRSGVQVLVLFHYFHSLYALHLAHHLVKHCLNRVFVLRYIISLVISRWLSYHHNIQSIIIRIL